MKKSTKKKIDNIIFWGIIGVFIGIIGCYIYAAERIIKDPNMKFTDEDWQYIYSDIENEFGDGEEFHVISADTDWIKGETDIIRHADDTYTYDYEIRGIKASVVGYFDSKDNIYAVVYAKYRKDDKAYKLYKDVEPGSVVFVTVVSHYSKDEYFKGRDK